MANAATDAGSVEYSWWGGICVGTRIVDGDTRAGREAAACKQQTHVVKLPRMQPGVAAYSKQHIDRL